MSDITKCTLCGLCKSNCPSFRIIKKERHSPRGRIMLIREEKDDDSFYTCNMCGACTVECPNEVKIDVRKKRKEMIASGRETQANKKMIENVRKFGNPFGEEKDEEPKDLYCC